MILAGFSTKNSVSWTALLTGLAQNGEGEMALSYFRKMMHEKSVAANDVTYVSALSATRGCQKFGGYSCGWIDRRRRWGWIFRLCTTLTEESIPEELQSTHMASKQITEEAVYLCTGNPLPEQICRWLLNEHFGHSCKRIFEIKTIFIEFLQACY
ncbi:pentatricopeptide repeat (PPR) superfamily protein [Striga asiatica]|uniref:Pentatricopeptide repeat (PPR) superfamily protein n=1 Tax=Striga asiatica TaxID=4170 RepID=A0A5A7RC00_STRAF|nr:pentatricopeptide repeat (PPR) superfamily protein [Striga asiatica]